MTPTPTITRPMTHEWGKPQIKWCWRQWRLERPWEWPAHWHKPTMWRVWIGPLCIMRFRYGSPMP